MRTRRRKVEKVQPQTSQLADSWNGGGVSMASSGGTGGEPEIGSIGRSDELSAVRLADLSRGRW
jgi:hypothetical protein